MTDSVLKYCYYRKRKDNSALSSGERSFARQYVNGWKATLDFFQDVSDIKFMQAELYLAKKDYLRLPWKDYAFRSGKIDCLQGLINDKSR